MIHTACCLRDGMHIHIIALFYLYNVVCTTYITSRAKGTAASILGSFYIETGGSQLLLTLG